MLHCSGFRPKRWRACLLVGPLSCRNSPSQFSIGGARITTMLTLSHVSHIFHWILLQQSPGLTETAFVKANKGTQSLQKYVLSFRPPHLAPRLLSGVVHPCLDTGSFGPNYQLWMALSLVHIGRVRHLCLSMFHWFLSPCRGIFSGSPKTRHRQVTLVRISQPVV